MTTLIHAAQSGDHAAFAALITLYRPMSMRVAMQILRTEMAAEDAVQDAMIKVWRALPGYQDGNFRSWLLRIVTNTCYDHLRRAKRRRSLSLDELIEDSDAESQLGQREVGEDENPEVIFMHQEPMDEILAAIDGLAFWHRNAVILVDVQGLDYEEAAAHLCVPVGTVKSRLSRGRAALRGRINTMSNWRTFRLKMHGEYLDELNTLDPKWTSICLPYGRGVICQLTINGITRSGTGGNAKQALENACTLFGVSVAVPA